MVKYILFFALTAVVVLSAPYPTARAGRSPAPSSLAPTNAGSNIRERQQVTTYTVYLPTISQRIPPDPFGVTMFEPVDASGGIDHVRAAGIRWVTLFISWAAIEPAEGQFDWAATDSKIVNAYTAGMQIWALFADDPRWAWLPDRSNTVPEKRLAFVRTLVERYDCDGLDDAPGSPCIDYWSFYAEPDAYYSYMALTPGAKGFWGRRGSDYADMIAPVARAAREQNPRAKIAIGGIAYDWFEDQNGPFVRSFLGDVLTGLNARHGSAAATLDGMAFHYYQLNFPTIRDKALKIRSVMDLHGVGHLPLFVPETGYWSSIELGSSELYQAQWLVQLYTRALSVGVQQTSWFTVFDLGSQSGEVGLFWGRDLTRPKLSYTAYQVMARELAQPTYLGALSQPGIEGYIFQTRHRPQQTVLWALGAKRNMVFENQCLRLVDLAGKVAAPIYDGDSTWDQDKKVNGRITLLVQPNAPIYVSPC